MAALTILTYEEWKEAYITATPDAIREALMQMHGINAGDDIEAALQAEYQVYVANRQSQLAI